MLSHLSELNGAAIVEVERWPQTVLAGKRLTETAKQLKNRFAKKIKNKIRAVLSHGPKSFWFERVGVLSQWARGPGRHRGTFYRYLLFSNPPAAV